MGVTHLRIRGADGHDLPQVLELCREHAAYEGSEYVADGHAGRLAAALFGPHPLLFGWVVDAGDGLAGYMTATIDFATWTGQHFLHMDCLYVREPFRGRGLGLVETLTGFAHERGIELIQWQTPAHNQSAIEFYHRIGATSKDKKRYFLRVS
jgi:ribosomal protein S18 acetylase RimI-like enzyme